MSTATCTPPSQARPVLRPAADVFETDTAWLIRLDMPGVASETTEITVEDRILTVSGTNTLALPESAKALHTEFAIANYRRSFSITDAVDTDGISAQVRNGVVTVTLPKAQRLKPRKIAINAG